VLATRFWTAVKTGTSKDMRDNWALGWSQRYTVGVWVGNASGAAMHDVSGTSGAAPIWAAVMQQLHARTPSRAPLPPAGLTAQRVSFGAQLEAARSEWFLPGTAQARFAINFIADNDPSTPGRGQKSLKMSLQALRRPPGSPRRPMAPSWRWTRTFPPPASACASRPMPRARAG
jgi:penicillin-binding protein 1C